MQNQYLPGNLRYQPKNLAAYFGYDKLSCFIAMVEIANLRALAQIGIIPADDIALLTPEIEEKLLAIPTTLVDEVERKDTKHDIRAWIKIAQEILPVPLRRWLHVGLTSYDAIDTARALQFAGAHRETVTPLLKNVARILARKVEEHAHTLQIGRTHGQHALPITVGFWLATVLNRIVVNAKQMGMYADGLVGKISGAVGAYNAQKGLKILDRCNGSTFEELVLKELGLRPATISTQIAPPEPLAYYLFSATMMSASLGQFGRDSRHLMRTEISEIREPFAKGQVGSSTMAHKRNPLNFENTDGMFIRTKNEFGKVMDTLISEHQRDLVGSSVARDFPIIIVNLVQQLNTLLRKGERDEHCFLERIGVDAEACKRNFALQANVVLAEAIYIALQMAGYEGDAHKLVNHSAVPHAQQNQISLMNAVEEIAIDDPELDEAVQRIPPEVGDLLRTPESYTGLAAEKAMEIAGIAREYVG